MFAKTQIPKALKLNYPARLLYNNDNNELRLPEVLYTRTSACTMVNGTVRNNVLMTAVIRSEYDAVHDIVFDLVMEYGNNEAMVIDMRFAERKD